MKKLTTLLKKKNRGFTLIEIIVVIAILAILAALAIPAIAGYIQNSKAQTNMANGKMIYNAASAYLASNPSELDVDLATLITDNFLASIPQTAEKNDFTLTITDGKPVVTWEPETEIDPEIDGTYPPASPAS